MSRQPKLLEVAAANVGVMGAARCMRDIVMWSLAMATTDEPWPEGNSRGDITERVRLYAQATHVSESTAWRHVARYRKALPGEVDPTRIVQAIQAERATKKRLSEAEVVGSSYVPPAPA